jgi:aspartyl-tRNA(Asn)/glutamyl-tRNA(Gln) amidotransferase subunit B
MEWEVVIGLETHVQLSTKSKIFSGASASFGAAPNTHSCPVDLALPGCLPVLNKGAVERAIRFGVAIGATVANHSVFARKNYFYPDLPKGYQISQFEYPVVIGGEVSIDVEAADGSSYKKTVHLTRAHLEEDAGKSIHGILPGKTGIDLNRAGTPLLEIVTEPDMRSAEEAVAYAKALHELVVWIGISDGDMQNGNFRCDANVSVRPKGQKEYGTRTEIKNLNSFRFLQAAIEYEVRRQIDVITAGGKIIQATMLYDPDQNETRVMRSKEDSMDYRYFPDPDLLPLEISDEWIDQVRSEMPELPAVMKNRFLSEYGLKEDEVAQLASDRHLAEYFDEVVRLTKDAKNAANWIRGEVLSRLNEAGIAISASPLSAQTLAQILIRFKDGTINQKGARTLIAELWEKTGESVDGLIEKLGIKQISDSSAIEAVIDQVLAENQAMVEEFRSGKEKAFNALVGRVMRASKGKANPAQVNELLRAKL